MTNYLFSPIDAVGEFFAGMVSVLAMNHFYFKNPFGVYVSIWTMVNWYAAGHDENLQLPHSQHHKQINSIYAIYLDYKDVTAADAVRKAIKLNIPGPPREDGKTFPWQIGCAVVGFWCAVS